MVEHSPDFRQLVALRIPTRDQMRDAAAALPFVQQDYFTYSEGPRRYLFAGPGLVGLTTRNDRTPKRARGEGFGLHVDAALLAAHRESVAVAAAERAWLNEPMSLVDMPGDAAARVHAIAREGELIELPKRGKITSWSRRSRLRMEKTLQSLDFMPLFDEGDIPAMVTLTMPGRFWEQCAPTPAAFKKQIEKFQLYYSRAWGVKAVGVWKMEFQRRGAPHVHILMTPPRGVSADRAKLSFSAWLSSTWSRIVTAGLEDAETPVPWSPEGYRAAIPKAKWDHIKAGTGVDYVEGQRYLDPKRMAQYFSKHGAYTAKEYQNAMPTIWLDAIEGGAGGVGFWGYWGLRKALIEGELSSTADRQNYVKCDATWPLEEAARWASDASVLRAWARDQMPGPVSDSDKVERHLRKLARSMAAKRHAGQIVQKIDKRGQKVTDMRIRVLRGTRDKLVDGVNDVTGEVRQFVIPTRYRSYRVGYYTGGNGFLSVNDGRITLAGIHRILGGAPLDRRSSYDLLA